MRIPLVGTVALAVVGLSLTLANAEDWPGFRGAHGGVASDTNLPAKITSDNILYKVKLPGPGSSSPIILGDKLLLTCYTGYGLTITRGFGKGGFGKGGKGGFGKGKGGFGKGKGGFGKGGFGGFGGGPDTGGDQKKLRLVLLCLDRANGKTLWQKDIEPKLPETPFSGMMREHGYATSTPVTDGKAVYVFFGKTGVFAFDLQGKQLWQTDVGSKKHMWGSGASPVLFKDLVIVNAAIESGALIALHKKDGSEAWRVKGLGTTWSTPVLVEPKKGEPELVLSLPGKVVGYDPATGKELWHCKGIGSAGGFGSYTSSTPVVRDGVVYVIGGGGGGTRATALAVRAGGRGNVDQSHVLWRQKAGTSVGSPVLAGERLCWVSGSINCLNVKDGEIALQEELYNSRNEYVSAVAGAGKLYALTRTDGLFVLEAGGKCEQLAHLTFTGDDSVFNASPAISDGKLYLRSNAYLYCLGARKP